MRRWLPIFAICAGLLLAGLAPQTTSAQNGQRLRAWRARRQAAAAQRAQAREEHAQPNANGAGREP
ncbi:MAG: hypothetical protein WAM67_11620, partial [Candidatus Acidiferrales bacterium]